MAEVTLRSTARIRISFPFTGLVFDAKAHGFLEIYVDGDPNASIRGPNA